MQTPNLCSTKEEISQMLIEGVEELIGQEDMQRLLKRELIAFGFDEYQQLHLEQPLTHTEIIKLEQGLEEMFGKNGSRGAALRTGRSFFQSFFQKYGVGCGLNSLEYRMRPLKKRILTGLETLSFSLSNFIHLDIKVSEDAVKWYWTFQDGPGCLDENGEGMPVDDFSIGLLQAFLSWASGGKAYPIHKNTGPGSGCVIEIGKKAIG